MSRAHWARGDVAATAHDLGRLICARRGGRARRVDVRSVRERFATATVTAERDLATDLLGLLRPERDLTALDTPPTVRSFAESRVGVDPRKQHSPSRIASWSPFTTSFATGCRIASWAVITSTELGRSDCSSITSAAWRSWACKWSCSRKPPQPDCSAGWRKDSLGKAAAFFAKESR